MQIKNHFSLGFFSVLVVFLMGCSPSTEIKKLSFNQSSTSSATSLDSKCLDTSTNPNPRPSRLCGESGYTYLLNTYIKKNCGNVCHTTGNDFSLAPFADTDAHLSYLFAVNYPNNTFEERFMQNGFVPGECLLKEGYSLLSDLREWSQNKNTTCP